MNISTQNTDLLTQKPIMTMDNTILAANMKALAELSVIFCTINNVTPPSNDEEIKMLGMSFILTVGMWYDMQGKTFDVCTDLIENDALVFAFGEMSKAVLQVREQMA